MITVLPIQTKKEQKELAGRCGVPFREELLAYRAENDGTFAGICQFRMDAAGGHIADLACPVGGADEDALFVMGRAALNFIDLCGVHTAFFEGEPTNPALLRRIGFRQDEHGVFAIDLAGFFTHPCSHAEH